MITITLNAFSFLKPKLAARQIACTDAQRTIAAGATVEDLIAACGLAGDEVEGVFHNGRTAPRNQALHDGDRIALVPPGGTPGPHRFLLRIKELPRRQDG